MSDLYPQIRAEESVARWMDEHAEQLHDAGGVIPPEILGLIDANDAEFEAKTETLVLIMRTLEAQAAAAQIEADRIRELGASRKRKAATIKANILRAMVETGRAKVETDLCSVRRAKSGPSVRLIDPEQIPDRFLRTKYSFDATAAKAAWADAVPEEPGERVLEDEGIVLVRGEHLRIR